LVKRTEWYYRERRSGRRRAKQGGGGGGGGEEEEEEEEEDDGGEEEEEEEEKVSGRMTYLPRKRAAPPGPRLLLHPALLGVHLLPQDLQLLRQPLARASPPPLLASL